jgi:YlmC/YmxH family sporulation protein
LFSNLLAEGEIPVSYIRLSDLEGKEVINLVDGARLGVIGEADIVIDIHSGDIQSIIMPQRNNFFGMWMDRQNVIIPWQAVKKIGNEVVIVELDSTVPNLYRYPG